MQWIGRRWSRKTILAGLLGGLLLCCGAILTGWLINVWMLAHVQQKIFTQVNELSDKRVAVVLGTSARTRGGYANPHFTHRMEAAAAAYHAGKLKHLILSGDNGQKEYDEPTDMRAALLERGVPATVLTLDYAGFRTLDSIARAKAVFGQTQLTIISDDFHVPRALFLAECYGIQAIGLSARPVAESYSQKTRWRESFARIAAVIDVYLLGTKPKFYGPPVQLAE